jgi:hypothetical protein
VSFVREVGRLRPWPTRQIDLSISKYQIALGPGGGTLWHFPLVTAPCDDAEQRSRSPNWASLRNPSWQGRNAVLDQTNVPEARPMRGVGNEVCSDVEGSERCIRRGQ